MDIQIKNQLIFAFFLLIVNITTNLTTQIPKNNKYYSYFNEYLYNHSHCLNNVSNNNLVDISLKEYEKYKECLKNQSNNYCRNYTSQDFLKELKILSPEDTINEIIYNNKSISRFGDGEFTLIFGYGIPFQKENINLSNRLYNILKSNEEGLLIGLPNSLNVNYLDNFIDFSKNYWSKWIENNQYKFMLFDKNKTYYSSFITRFYMSYKDKSNVDKYIQKLKKIWAQKDILIIEGEKSRLGIGNDLFNDAKSILRIICPSLNAFEVYDKILSAALKIDKNRIILIALGPTATVLAYDLYKAGYHVVDVGHVDIEYEWYLRNATTKIKIENKFVNEVKDGNMNIEDIIDKNYYNQIIEKVLN